MLIAIILAPLASLLWAITNHIDKYLVSKIIKNGDIKGLLVFSSLVAGVILSPISLIMSKFNIGIDLFSFGIILLSATTFLFATGLYFKALNKNDASLVTIMFQLIPVFGYFLGLIFLNQALTSKQILGGIVIIISSIAATYEADSNKISKGKLTALLLMAGSSLLYAVYFLLFNITTVDNSFNVMTFWYQMALAINGLLLVLFIKSFRKAFIDLIMNNTKKVLKFNLLNEVLNLIANIFVNYAITVAPLALVLTLNGFQPFFVFLIGLVGTMLLPKVFNENISKRSVIHKAVCITASIVGLAILYL